MASKINVKKSGNKYRLNLPGIGEFGISQKDIARYVSRLAEADMLQQKVNNLRNKIGVKNTHRTGILSGYTVDNPIKSSNFSKKDYAKYHINKLKKAFNIVNDGGTKSPKYGEIVGKGGPQVMRNGDLYGGELNEVGIEAIRPKRKKTKKVKRNRVNITPIHPDPIKDVVNTMENTPAPGYVLTPAQQIAANVTNRILGPVQGGPPARFGAAPVPDYMNPVATTAYVERPDIDPTAIVRRNDAAYTTMSPEEAALYGWGGFMKW